MSTPWPTHRDIKIHIKNGTYDTILINTGICFTLVARPATILRNLNSAKIIQIQVNPSLFSIVLSIFGQPANKFTVFNFEF